MSVGSHPEPRSLCQDTSARDKFPSSWGTPSAILGCRTGMPSLPIRFRGGKRFVATAAVFDVSVGYLHCFIYHCVSTRRACAIIVHHFRALHWWSSAAALCPNKEGDVLSTTVSTAACSAVAYVEPQGALSRKLGMIFYHSHLCGRLLAC